MEKTKKAPAPKQEVKQETWEYKDRNYYLLNEKAPLTHTLPSRHSARYPLVWFDPDTGYERELRYASNHKSVFVDEQKGAVTLKHIVFEKGHLMVPKEKRNLQEFLIKHPHRDLVFTEFDAVVVAEDQYDTLELEIAAMNMAYDMDVDKSEAILRVESGSNVSKMSSKELKRDILLFAKKNPSLFLELAQDENVELRNFAIKAVEARVINLSSDQRSFSWASNNRKLMNVPFDENPYSAMAAWFKTDEGVEVYKSIQKKLK
jgi:hypothetical protein|tara:strand:+ start:41 stop:823 length:783 start_codon:yes stop_codon:yes gene_type:complete